MSLYVKAKKASAIQFLCHISPEITFYRKLSYGEFLKQLTKYSLLYIMNIGKGKPSNGYAKAIGLSNRQYFSEWGGFFTFRVNVNINTIIKIKFLNM